MINLKGDIRLPGYQRELFSLISLPDPSKDHIIGQVTGLENVLKFSAKCTFPSTKKNSSNPISQMPDLTHFDDAGAARMVDVSAKPETERSARASALVRMQPSTLTLIRDKQVSKGDVLEIARISGIMAAKKTADLIPLCHPLPLTSIKIEFSFPSNDSVQIEATAKVFARTGVEMEALTAVSVAALTVYDMCKAADRAMIIERICLEEKDGGKSGSYVRSKS
jgi:cyclic pyranopterin phosphate synthase